MDRDALLNVVSTEMRPYIDKIEEVYQAPFARHLGLELKSLAEDTASLTMQIRPEHINSRGFVHGAVIYAAMDHTLAFSAGIKEDCVGQSSNVIYHRPMQGGELSTESELINQSKTLKIFDIRAYSNGKLIASGVFTAFRVGGW